MIKKTGPIFKIHTNIIATTILSAFCFIAIAQDSNNRTVDLIFRPKNNITQFAVWIEDANGNYIATVYLSNFIGRRGGGNRTSDSNIDSNTGNRLSALPIWCHKRAVTDTTFGIKNLYPPPESKPSYPNDIDAISGATPGTSIQKKTWQLQNLPDGDYNCWIEANKSFDFNDSYNYSFYRGQPSVVWKTPIHIGGNPDTNVVLSYFGYGSPDGSDGVVNSPDSTITTANELLYDMGGFKFKVIFTPTEITAMQNQYFFPSQIHCFVLDQNWPNPFNSITSISYSILNPSQVIMKIYNMHGDEVQTLVDGFHLVGKYSVDFMGKDLSSGIYFCKIQVGNGLIGTKRMMLIH